MNAALLLQAFGGLWADSYFDFMSEDVMYDRKLSQHLNVLPRRCDEPIKEEHIDLARSVQAILDPQGSVA